MSTNHLIVAGLTTVIMALGGCKTERERTKDRARDEVAQVEHDATRDQYIREARSKLDELKARIDQLGARADVESQEAAAKMRAKRDDLAARIERAELVTQSKWDEFKADLVRSIQVLQGDLDSHF